MAFIGITISPGKVKINGRVFDIPSDSFCRVKDDKVFINGVELKAPRHSAAPACISFSGCTFEDPSFKNVRYVKLMDCEITGAKAKLSTFDVHGDIHGDVSANSCKLTCSSVGGRLKAISSSIEVLTKESPSASSSS